MVQYYCITVMRISIDNNENYKLNIPAHYVNENLCCQFQQDDFWGEMRHGHVRCSFLRGFF